MTEDPPARVDPDAADSIGEALSALTRAIKAIDDAHKDDSGLGDSGTPRIRALATEDGDRRPPKDAVPYPVAPRDNRPLVRSFRDGQRPWYEGHKSPLLNPRQLEYLARRAEGLPPSETSRTARS